MLLGQIDSTLSSYFKGSFFLSSNQYDSAEIYINKCLIIDGNNTEFLKTLANIYFIKKDYQKAKNQYLRLNNIKTNIADLELAKCYSAQNKNDSAFIYLNSHIDSKYKIYASKIKLDPYLKKLENDSLWNTFWENEWYSKYEHQIADIEYNIKNSNTELALDELHNILSKRKRAYKAYYLRSKIYYESKDYKLALNDISDAIDIKRNKHDYHFLRSNIHFQLKKYSKAIIDINEAINIYPYNIEYYLHKALILDKLENFEPAIQNYLFYINNTTQDYRKYYYLSQLYLSSKDKINALKQINIALKLNRHSKDLYILRGDVYFESGIYKYAIQDYTMSLDFDPQNGYVYYKRAVARHNLGNTKGACSDWFKARNLKNVDSEEYLRKYCVK